MADIFEEVTTFKELNNAVTEYLDDLVNTWWARLSDNERQAITLLDFDRGVISSKMFFSSDPNFNTFAYSSLWYPLERHFQTFYDSGAESSFYGVYGSWRSMHIQELQTGKQIDDLPILAKLSPKLAAEVKQELLEQDKDYQDARAYYHSLFEEYRRANLWNAIDRLKKRVQ